MRRHTVIILLLFLFPSKARAQMGQLFPSLSFLMPPMSVTIHAEAIAPDMTFERRGWTEFRKSDTGERFRVSHPFGYETYPGANDFNFYRLANGSFIVADISQGIQVASERSRLLLRYARGFRQRTSRRQDCRRGTCDPKCVDRR